MTHEQGTERQRCQKRWAAEKYLVLSRSQKLYKEIREYLKSPVLSESELDQMIAKAKSLPEDRGQMLNAAQHVWGYFKKKANQQEKEDYLFLMECYRWGRIDQEDLLAYFRTLLERYPDTYLASSTLLFPEEGQVLNRSLAGRE